MKALDKAYMLAYFQKRKEKFLSKNEKLIDLKIDLVRNFRDKFRNMSLKYELKTNKKNYVVRAKIHKHQDTPYREWSILKWLGRHDLAKFVSAPLDYSKELNIFFYAEAPGESMERLFWKQGADQHIQFVPDIAQFLQRLHKVPQPKFLPIKDEKQEKKERRHWFFLVRKCGRRFYPRYSKLLKKLGCFRYNNKDIFLNLHEFRIMHGDFHWGNIIKVKGQKSKVKGHFRVIDFGYSFLGDPLEDVGGFLAQTRSMLRYYCPDFLSLDKKIRNIFIKNYFGNPISKSVRLTYFEIQKILEMAAILVFVETKEENKSRGMERLLNRAEKKIEEL